MAWEDISSTEYQASCGDDGSHTASNMLDASGEWWHVVNHTHTLTLDMGSSKIISKIRTKAVAGSGTTLPSQIVIYVSDTIGTWGTAVDTIDITGDSSSLWTERVLATAKTGRYIYLEIDTVHRNNFIIWGSATTKVLDFYTGALPKRWTSVINLTALNYSTASTTYVPTDGALCLLEWDGSKYSNIVEAYFEATGSVTGGEGATWSVELYDRTNTTQIATVNSTGSVVKRSADISSSLDSGVVTLDVRVSASAGATATQKSARLIIVQETDTTDKMRVYLPVGQRFGIRGSNYLSGKSEMINADCEHQYKYLAANFKTISAAYFHANIKAAATTTAYAKLDSVDADDPMGEVSTTLTVPTLLKSSDISASLTNATIYTMYCKNSSLRSTTAYNGWLVFDLDPVNKFEFSYDICAFGKLETTNTGWQTSTDYQLTYNTGDNWCYGCDSETVKHAVVSGETSATSITSAIYDDNVRDATSEQVETSTGANYNEDSTIGAIADDSTIKASWNVNALPLFAKGNLWMNNLLVLTKLEATGTNQQLNISNDWKEITAEQINIGDAWKSVVGKQINMGDVWKVIY